MKIVKPSYFDDFRCIAGACTDSCCKEWDVQVDDQAAAFYLQLPGELGDRLRQVLREEDEEMVMTIVDGRCPMWREDGLCRIQAALGHEALCKTCREFPRLSHDFGDFQELGLELSCPEAARFILRNPDFTYISEHKDGGEDPEYDQEAMEDLLRSREIAREILKDTQRPINEVLASLLMYGYQAQGELDGEEILPFDPDATLDAAQNYAGQGSEQLILDFFKDLEIRAPEWAERLDNPQGAPWTREHLTLARYFVDRYWLQAVADYNLVSRVKLAVISCLTIRMLGGNLEETAQRYSKEIENDVDNIDAILDGAYESPAFTDDKLLGLLLK